MVSAVCYRLGRAIWAVQSGDKNQEPCFQLTEGRSAPVPSPSDCTPLSTTVFPPLTPHPNLRPALRTSSWRGGSQAESQRDGPDSQLQRNSFLSQEGRVHPGAREGTGFWAGPRGEPAQRPSVWPCLPLPALPCSGSQEPGGCPAPGWARAARGSCSPEGPAQCWTRLPPRPHPHPTLTLLGCDEETKLCPHLGLLAPARSWHPPRPKALQLALL